LAKLLITDKPYERFSPGRFGLAPGVAVTLHMPASKRKIAGKKAIIDTGAEITQIYPRDVEINIATDVDGDPVRRTFLVGIEVEGEIYYVQCAYQNHDHPGTEAMLLGIDILSHWLVTLHGRRRLLSITHLDPND